VSGDVRPVEINTTLKQFTYNVLFVLAKRLTGLRATTNNYGNSGNTGVMFAIR